MGKSDPYASGRARFEEINGPPPGKFIDTKHGSTHYILEGPTKGPLVVLQHGIGSDFSRMDRIARDLVALGYRVLRYDFYDRGYSESDPKRYPIHTLGAHPLPFTMELHVEQMQEVLQNLKLDKTPLVHCGHSLGGLTGIAYTSEYPDHVKGLVLIDSVCFPANKPILAYVADLPVVGNFLTQQFGVQTFMKFAKGCNFNPDDPVMKDSLVKIEQNCRTNPRYFSSVRSSNTHCRGLVGSAEPEFRKCCKASFPIHLIWGKSDTSVPYEACQKLREIAEDAGSIVTELSFEGMPHNVFFEDAKPEECSKSICEFVGKVYKK